MNLSALLAWAASRLREPSTLASLAALLAMTGLNLDAGTLHTIAITAAAVLAALGVIVAERSTKSPMQIAEDVLALLEKAPEPASAPAIAPKPPTT